MMHAVAGWLASLYQTIKVRVFRYYYRLANALAWRGQVSAGPCTNISIPVAGATIRARLYSNALGAPKPLLVYIHGGGWVIGDLRTHHPFCQALREASGCTVISLDYRLAPEHTFPTAQDDCVAATQWIVDHVRELGSNNGRLVIAGDSAGGNLATCACLELEPVHREKVLGQALIYPATDHYDAGFDSYVEKARGQTLTADVVRWFWDTYLGGLSAQAADVQRAFPLRSPSLALLPPTLLVTAENDPLRDEGKAYAIKLQQAGVAVTSHHFAGEDHGFACSEGPTEDFRSFMNQLNTWLAQLD